VAERPGAFNRARPEYLEISTCGVFFGTIINELTVYRYISPWWNTPYLFKREKIMFRARDAGHQE
jgi:hypothetical protein